MLLAATRNNITRSIKDCNPFFNLFSQVLFSVLFQLFYLNFHFRIVTHCYIILISNRSPLYGEVINFALVFVSLVFVSLLFLLGAVILARLACISFFEFCRNNKETQTAVFLSIAEDCIRKDDDQFDVGQLIYEAANTRPDTSGNMRMLIFCGLGSAGAIFMAVVLFVRSF